MISVLAVDYHSGKFRDILEDSLRRNADPDVPYELLIHDNGAGENLGHGGALDLLVSQAKERIILVLDIDSHILLPHWNTIVKDLFETRWKEGVKLIAGEGGQLKPVRPCVMLFERRYFMSNGMTFKPQNLLGAHFDVGVLFNFQVLSHGDKVEYFPHRSITAYPGTIGSTFGINGPSGETDFVFHHWYGTRWYNGRGEMVHPSIDGLTYERFLESKSLMEAEYLKRYA